MELLNKASVFVLPSYSEGCPYVIIEAMALKKIIIGTSVGNIPEMLSGNCGILVEPENKEELKEKLYQVITQRDKFEETRELAYKKIIKEYTIDSTTNKILSMIEKLTEKRN